MERLRKVMENEISGSSIPVTGTISRDLNSGSGSRVDHGGEIQKTWSPMYIRDKHDYNNLNKSSLRVQDLTYKLPCTYESVSGDISVLFLLLVSSNKGFAVRYL
jgi:hypothetical protein